MFVGGAGSTDYSVEKVAGELSPAYYEEVDAFPLRYALTNPDVIARCAVGADAYSHSAGAIALFGIHPREEHAFAAPVPMSRAELLIRGYLNVLRLHVPGVGHKSSEEMLHLLGYDVHAALELIGHPDFSKKLLRVAARFDVVRLAIGAKQNGVQEAAIGVMTADAYFTLGRTARVTCANCGVRVVDVEGEHDRMSIDPKGTLEEYFDHEQVAA